MKKESVCVTLCEWVILIEPKFGSRNHTPGLLSIKSQIFWTKHFFKGVIILCIQTAVPMDFSQNLLQKIAQKSENCIAGFWDMHF